MLSVTVFYICPNVICYYGLYLSLCCLLLWLVYVLMLSVTVVYICPNVVCYCGLYMS